MVNTEMTASGDALVLQCNDNSNFKPHPPGIYQGVCIDVIDLGLVWTEFQGKRKLVRKLKLVFETDYVGEDGKRGIVTKKFTASLYPNAKLTGFLGQWRGRQIVPGDNVDLKKLPGACCTLVLSHQQSMAGRTYVSIDAVSKATKKVVPSGTYDAAATGIHSSWTNTRNGFGCRNDTRRLSRRCWRGTKSATAKLNCRT